ncbi:RING-11 protein [Rostrohypoxylon terebratum]|nr:RING-11 protein [Rostrohypoxylon terebratum]
MAPRTRSEAAKSTFELTEDYSFSLPADYAYSQLGLSAPTPTTSLSNESSTPANNATSTPVAVKNSPAGNTRGCIVVKIAFKPSLPSTPIDGGRFHQFAIPATLALSMDQRKTQIPITFNALYDSSTMSTSISAPPPLTMTRNEKSTTSIKFKSQIAVEIPQIPSNPNSINGNEKGTGSMRSHQPATMNSTPADGIASHVTENKAARGKKRPREDSLSDMDLDADSDADSDAYDLKGGGTSAESSNYGSDDDDESNDSNVDSVDSNDSDGDVDYEVVSRARAQRRRPAPRNNVQRKQPPSKRQKRNDSDGEHYQYNGDIRYAPENVLKSLVPIHMRLDKAESKKWMLETRHPTLKAKWDNLRNMPPINVEKAAQPANIKRSLKPFQLTGLAWMKAMEAQRWKGGVLGDEMGLGKTIQAVSLIMSDYPAGSPSLVLAPPVALMQWVQEIESYTSGQLKTLMYHGTNLKSKKMTLKELKKFDVIIMSYNSLEAMYRKQEKGVFKGEGTYKEKSVMHQMKFHRIVLDEAHCIKSRSSGTAKACFALHATYRWCLTGTPLQNRIGEFFSLLRFLELRPYASYVCKSCPCECLEWAPDERECCSECGHTMLMHISIFNQEILTPIKKYQARTRQVANALEKLQLLTSRLMLRRLKKDHMDSMELPVKEINIHRQRFSEEEVDFANSIMKNSQRQFSGYVEQAVVLNNYANIFGLIMQMRQTADHPDLILKKDSEGGQNVLVCCICDEPAEEAIRSKCKHDFCRTCAKNYIDSQEEPDCPQCHIPLSIDLEQPEIEQDSELIKKSSIINRIKMENWKSSTKIELLVYELYRLRSDKMGHKSIIFSQFTSMLQLIQWRLQRAGISTVMLDGSMNPAQRQASINHFMNNVDVEVFLVSLKAGGVALNLTEASRVFIVDPWWNPAAEWQSADRCHRIGQTRPCIITRLCIEDSVESRMVLLQEKKSRMINSTVNTGTVSAALETLSTEDLSFLFSIS